MDVAGGMAAKRHSNTIDAVHFLNPIKKGCVAKIYARVNRSWNSSMEVEVLVQSEILLTGECLLCCHAYFTFVAIKDEKPILVPKIVPKLKEEILRWESADTRRTIRFQRKKNMKPELIKPTDVVYANGSCQIIKMIMPEHTNPMNITFGGMIMSWMEHAAYIAATRATRTHLLTASMDQLQFHRPSMVGHLVTIVARVTKVFKQSVEVYIVVRSEDPITNQVQLTNDAWISFVSVDQNGKPFPLSDVEEIGEVKTVEAEKRKNHRLEEKRQILSENSEDWDITHQTSAF
ncbi:Thioesterase/thiol ester dehydrase-isomerase [Rozella allomycis CSF55]|uniref:Thioesterase/thiol ester dehydrase-isomerase n=1 Tax=Rozella allomycis (strain CSF55) TaxID=988480 RepID=A0A075B1G8_ROZAC|nr:hypothetical protein O9G_001925 [Rozella allomycis CSF55]RKP20797.1 Thioesterase/thiol ester dehydrase-isomerase [Rozella allomycis CSF55]|eukprot:EPZ34623.1 hypothetical protein O9G_001925 [Rozella allomycis CSF55]